MCNVSINWQPFYSLLISPISKISIRPHSFCYLYTGIYITQIMLKHNKYFFVNIYFVIYTILYNKVYNSYKISSHQTHFLRVNTSHPALGPLSHHWPWARHHGPRYSRPHLHICKQKPVMSKKGKVAKMTFIVK